MAVQTRTTVAEESSGKVIKSSEDPMAASVKQMAMLVATLLVSYPSSLEPLLRTKSGLAGLAAAMLLWPTITEQLHLTRNVHHNLQTECPTAKTGLVGGAAFVSLDSTLTWLVALMLADNAREDYFDEVDGKGQRGNNFTNDYDVDKAIKGSA